VHDNYDWNIAKGYWAELLNRVEAELWR